MSTNYKKGRQFEYSIKKALEEAGFYVARSAGSHSLVDLVSFSEKFILLIQCKKAHNISQNQAEKLLSQMIRTIDAPTNWIFAVVYSNKKKVFCSYIYNNIYFHCTFKEFLQLLQSQKEPKCLELEA